MAGVTEEHKKQTECVVLPASSRRWIRQALKLARNPRKKYEWEEQVSHMVLDARFDQMGFFIAGRAALASHERVQLDERVAALLKEQEPSVSHVEDYQAVWFSGALTLTLYAVAVALVTGSGWVDRIVEFSFPVISSWLLFVSCGISACATSMYMRGAMARRMILSNAVADVVSIIIGLFVGVISLGLPPIAAFCCWLAWQENSDIQVPSLLSALLKQTSSEPFRIKLQSIPDYVPETKRLATQYSGVASLQSIVNKVHNARDDDLGTMVAAYTVLAGFSFDDEAAVGSDVVVESEADSPEKPSLQWGVVSAIALGGLVGVLMGLNDYAACFESGADISYISIALIVFAGCLSGWLSARNAINSPDREDLRNRVRAKIPWNSFWVTFMVQLIVFMLR